MAFPVFQVLIETLIFTSLIGVIASQVSNPNENITGAALIMYGLITLLIVIGFVVALYKTMGIGKGMGR